MKPTWDGKRWRIRVMVEGKRHSFDSSIPGARGRKECERKYNDWLYNEASGEKTFGRVADEYLRDLEARNGKTSGSYIQSECYIRLYIRPALASRKMCKLTLRDYQSVINGASGASGEPLSHKTLSNIRAILMGIVKFGYADYQCELPRGELYIPKGHARNEKEILQRSDIARLFEPCELWYWRAFCFMCITGLRPSECLGIQIGDIEQDCVRIRRAVNSRNYITDGKNKNARRTVPIGATARSILNEIIDRNERMNLHTEWVFCAVDGQHGNQCTMRNQWARLKQERDLPGTLYSFRHTFVSMMKDQLSEAAIREYIGHSEHMDTYGTYSHEVDDQHKKTAEIIDLTFQNFAHNLPTTK